MSVIHPSTQKEPSENVDRSLLPVSVQPGREKLHSEDVFHYSGKNRFGSGRTTLKILQGENDMPDSTLVEFGERTQNLVRIFDLDNDCEISEESEGGKCNSGFWNHGNGSGSGSERRENKREEESEQVMVPSGKKKYFFFSL